MSSKIFHSLYDHIKDKYTPWHSPNGDAFVDVEEGAKTVPYPTMSSQLEGWIRQQARTGLGLSIITINTVKELQAALHSDALRGETRNVALRKAHDENQIVVDLGNNEFVKITKDGWTIESETEFRFYRPKQQLPLPRPQKGGNLDLFRKYISARNEKDFVLQICWILGCLNNSNEYPILIMNGEQGTGKSTQTSIFRELIDPAGMNSYQPPKEVRDLVAYARNGFMVPMDNISWMPAWLSDDLCRLALGSSGLGGRGLYTNDDLATFQASRPIIINGIPEVVERNDLVDRSLQITLPPINPALRRGSDEIMADFRRDKPLMMGFLYDMASKALAGKHKNTFARLPRMASFMRFVASASDFFGLKPQDIVDMYMSNRRESDASVLEHNPVAQALLKLLHRNRAFVGTLFDLQDKLFECRPAQGKWPDTNQKLANELRRLEPALVASGIQIYKNGREAGTGRSLFEFRIPDDGILVSGTRAYSNVVELQSAKTA